MFHAVANKLISNQTNETKACVSLTKHQGMNLRWALKNPKVPARLCLNRKRPKYLMTQDCEEHVGIHCMKVVGRQLSSSLPAAGLPVRVCIREIRGIVCK